MIQIRNGVFETNSSSTHSIVLADKNVEPGLFVDFAMGEFGWGFDKLATTDEKASYLYTAACCLYNRDVYQDLYEVLVKYGVECTCSVPCVKSKDGWIDNGWVNHVDGTEEFVERVMNHEHALIRYLFSDQSFVVTGNDNCDEDQYKWMEEQIDVDYPHTTFYKGN